MKIAIKEVGKELRVVDVDERYERACVKKFTGQDDPVEFVPLNDEGTFYIGVNENGLPLELPVNFLLGVDNPYYPIQKMVGTVVFVRHKYVNPWLEEIWDFEIEDLTDDDMRLIEKILSPEYQNSLAERFIDYGKGSFVMEKIFQRRRK